MTVSASMFDPYQQWLQISAEQRPPSHYELLGLPVFESDAARIHTAAMERMALVRRYQLGEHAETVIRLLGELSSAFDCLSDPDRRRTYDEQLRQAADSTAKTRLSPSRTPAVAMPPMPRPATVPASRKRTWMICGIGAAVAATVILLQLGSNEPPPADNTQHTMIAAGSIPDFEMPVLSGTAADVPPTTIQPRAGRDPRFKYFGYATAGPAAKIDKIAPYTNIVLVRDWIDRSHETVAAAAAAGLPVVLCINANEAQRFPPQFQKVLSAHAQSILAICWCEPYHAGHKATDVSNFGRKFKQAHPSIQYWVSAVDLAPDREGLPLMPAEIDVLVIHEALDDSPELVHAKAERVLPIWQQRAAGRPILWYWGSRSQRPKGLVPTTATGTFRACVEVAQKHKLAGVVFDRWGSVKGQERLPINSRPYLEEEVRELAGELGLDTEK